MAQPKFSHPDRIRYDGHCFTIDGKDVFLFSGAFHYFRCPRELWRDRFRMIKAAGFNAVETYVPWNWSEPVKPSGPADETHVDLADLDAWLTMAEKEFGLYTIVRPGPYICSEWASGGFPNWLPAFKPANPLRPMWYRSDDPVFEQWSRHWYQEVARVVEKHQLTHQPVGAHGVILWQVENEYDYCDQSDQAKRNYVKFLIEASQVAGIDVPIFTCWTHQVRDAKGDPVLSQAFDNPNEYPRMHIESVTEGIDAQHNAQPWAPKMVTEFQGGWFGGVGGQAAAEQGGIDARQINALTLNGIANGMTGLNYYMLFGGTNFGDWAAEGITTSYDYDAPLREWGGGGPKYRAVQAIGKMLEQYGSDLARSDEANVDTTQFMTAPSVKLIARKGKSGATYVFAWNQDRQSDAVVTIGTNSLTLDAFGMNVYRYESSPADGKWLVQPAAAPKETLPMPIHLSSADVSDLMPDDWKAAPEHPDTLALGVDDSRFITYRLTRDVPATGFVWLQSNSGELIANEPPVSERIQGGQGWKLDSGGTDFVLFNPGWPNGGMGMEQTHGMEEARLVATLPKIYPVAGWKQKMLNDQADRSLVAPDVDTSSWTAGPKNDLFLPNTTGILKGKVDLGQTLPKEMVFSCLGVDDEGYFYVNGNKVGEVHHWDTPVTFPCGKVVHPGINDVSIVIHNIDGEGGLTGAVSIHDGIPAGAAPAILWTDSYRPGASVEYALADSSGLPEFEHPKVTGSRPTGSAHLIRSRLYFAKPDRECAWQIVLAAGGDGFLSLNGHPLGRYWEVGPQRGYYLPPCWLRAVNELDLTVVPGRFGDRIKAAELRPLSLAP